VDTIDEIDDGTFFVRGSMGIKFVGVDRLHRQFMIVMSSHGKKSAPVVCDRSEGKIVWAPLPCLTFAAGAAYGLCFLLVACPF
jgi:hypothetical protein